MIDAATVEATVAVAGAVVALNTFATNALIRTQLQRLNGRYVQSPLFKAKHDALAAKLDTMQTYNSEHFHDIRNAMQAIVLEAGTARQERYEVTSRLVTVENAITAMQLASLRASEAKRSNGSAGI